MAEKERIYQYVRANCRAGGTLYLHLRPRGRQRRPGNFQSALLGSITSVLAVISFEGNTYQVTGQGRSYRLRCAALR